jgi:hypothetical protein
MSRSERVRLAPALLALSILFACTLSLSPPEPAAAQSANDNVVYLNQAWSQDDREWFYHFSQGSAVLSYDIFLNLEVPGGQDLFRSDANSERYGLIPEAASPYDPDGLPIGISKTAIATPQWKGEETGTFAGLTCAACHETQLEYKGKRVRIDGGAGNHFDIMGYIDALDDAIQTTLPASNYTGTLEVKPNGGGSSVEWRAEYLADGQGNIVVRTIVSTLFKTGLDSLKPRFGASR